MLLEFDRFSNDAHHAERLSVFVVWALARTRCVVARAEALSLPSFSLNVQFASMTELIDIIGSTYFRELAGVANK